MTEFLRLLAFYYLCDSTAAIRPMTAAEVAACMGTYEAVKTYFYKPGEMAPRGTTERGAQNRYAYAGFKAWEAENASLVAEMKAQARAEAALRS